MKRIDEISIARVVAAVLLLFLLVVTYGFCASIALSVGESEQYDRIRELAARGHAEGINRLLLETRSPGIKVIAMKYIDDLKSDTLIPALAQTLSYDLPWYYVLRSEISPPPHEVRFSAHDSLARYGPQRAGVAVAPLVSSSNVYERLYAAGVLMRWGDPRGEMVLDQLIQGSSRRIRVEAEWVRDEAKRERPKEAP